MANEVRGIRVLQDPKLNKSTAFTESEKQALGLVGLVADVIETEDEQLQRVDGHCALSATLLYQSRSNTPTFLVPAPLRLLAVLLRAPYLV
jgi:hypothetical protein